MDYETISPEAFGASLRGVGFNILVTDVRRSTQFLETVFQMTAHRVSDDFAIMTHGAAVMQLHADSTYAENPLLGLVPETRHGAPESRSGCMTVTLTALPRWPRRRGARSCKA